MVRVNWKKWFLEIAPELFNEMDIPKESKILDFGARNGDYSIPLALWSGKLGIVFALDKNAGEFNEIIKRSKNFGINNIQLIEFNWNKDEILPFNSKFFDVVFIFDILHYFDLNERNSLYKEIYRILKNNGLFITFPQHNLESYPMWNLADLSLSDIKKEIQDTGFLFNKKIERKIIHDHSWYEGIMLSFSKK